MLKKHTYFLFTVGAFLLGTNALAKEVKTSSLAMAKTQSSGKLPMQCQKMFQKADQLISDAEKQPGTHTQLQQMKKQLTSTKQQILRLDVEMQAKSCDKGLIALNKLERE